MGTKLGTGCEGKNITIPHYYPSSDSDGMFHDQLLETWRSTMENQFRLFPKTDRFVAMNAAYYLFRETIAAAFEAQPTERDACLKDLAACMGRVSDWRKDPKKAS